MRGFLFLSTNYVIKRAFSITTRGACETNFKDQKRLYFLTWFKRIS